MDVGVSTSTNTTLMSRRALNLIEQDREVFTDSVIYCLKIKCMHPECNLTTFRLSSVQLNNLNTNDDRKFNGTRANIKIRRPSDGEWIFDFYPVITATECFSFIGGVIGFWFGFSVIECKKIPYYFKRTGEKTVTHRNYAMPSVSLQVLPKKTRFRYLMYY